MDSSLALPAFFSAVGAAAGLLLQQTIDLLKLRTAHVNELKRRFFELKFQTAIDLARALDALVACHQARLAEATERTRDDENFSMLAPSRDVVGVQAKALEKDFDRYTAAFAVQELLFATPVVTALTEGGVVVFELMAAWRKFDEDWDELVKELANLIPDERMNALRRQRELSEYDESAREELVCRMAAYKSRNGKLRAQLSRLASLTVRAEAHRRSVLLAIRTELKAYHV